MDGYVNAISLSLSKCIVKDDLDNAKPLITQLSEILPERANTKKQFLRIAVKYSSHKIAEYMIMANSRLYSRDYDNGKYTILQYLISTCQSDAVAFMVRDNGAVKNDVKRFLLDRLIDEAYAKLEELKAPEHDHQHEDMRRLKKIIKCLLENPGNRYNERGIFLEVDESTLEIRVSSDYTLDVNKLNFNETVLEVWIKYKRIIISGGRMLPHVNAIVCDIIKYLIKHIVKLEAMGSLVSPNNEQAINSHCDYQQFKMKCSSEVKWMIDSGSKGDTVGYFFHILTACRVCLAGHAKNERIRKFFFSDSLMQLLPIYGKDIVETFAKSINEQMKLVNTS